MKKYNIILTLVSLLLLCSSCNDWLTVEPKATSTKDKMFSSELGFQSALIGLYLNLQANYTPGGFMMGGGLDCMANNYLVGNQSSDNVYYLLYIHRYLGSTVDGTIAPVFGNYYKVIANANLLLEGLKKQNFLDPNEAKLIEGEALAIRAFCHFELIRLWGPVPSAATATNKYLPYVTTFSTDQYQYTEYSAYMDSLKTDFTHSLGLLKEVDPIVSYSNNQLNNSYASVAAYKDLFWYNRQKRFNYYGVEALLARYYLWVGDKQDAYQMAKDVVSAVNVDNTPKFALGTQSDVSSNDYLLFNEHLVGLDIYEWIDRMGAFGGRYASLVNSSSAINSTLYGYETELRTNLFSSTFSYAYGQYVMGTIKYSMLAASNTTVPHSLPLIRLSEMYLILLETAPIDEANTYYQAFRSSRSASFTPVTETTRMREVVKEYVKEFFSEEQSFFAFKRTNAPSMYLSGQSVNAGAYVLPLPQDETGNYN